MKPLKKKEIDEMLQIWIDAYDESDGMNIYNRQVCTELRTAGYSISLLQDQIAITKVKSKDRKKTLTPTEKNVLELHKDLDIESDIARNEKLCYTPGGLKFLQSSQRGYSEKQSIDMNSNINLQDVIAENSCHKIN